MLEAMRRIWERKMSVLGERFPIDCGKGRFSRSYLSYIKIREFLEKKSRG